MSKNSSFLSKTTRNWIFITYYSWKGCFSILWEIFVFHNKKINFRRNFQLFLDFYALKTFFRVFLMLKGYTNGKIRTEIMLDHFFWNFIVFKSKNSIFQFKSTEISRFFMQKIVHLLGNQFLKLIFFFIFCDRKSIFEIIFFFIFAKNNDFRPIFLRFYGFSVRKNTFFTQFSV